MMEMDQEEPAVTAAAVELEDGEISSSEELQSSQDGNLFQPYNENRVLLQESPPRPRPTISTKIYDDHDAAAGGTSGSRRDPVHFGPDDIYDYDDDNSSESSSSAPSDNNNGGGGRDGDDDEEFESAGPPRAKLPKRKVPGSGSRSSYSRNVMYNFNNPNLRTMSGSGPSGGQESSSSLLSSSSSPSTLSSFERMAANYQTRRKNNVWGEVLREQAVGTAADELGFIAVSEDVEMIHRGPESFVVDNNLKRKFVDDGQELDIDSDQSVSSDGLSEDSKEFLVERRSSPTPSPRCPKRTTKYQEPGCKTQQILPQKGLRLKESILKATSSLSDENFCAFAANRLQERKTYLIARVLQFLGRDVVTHLLAKTLLIEKRGGILIKNGTRRRTSGGVFLYLLRGSKKYDQTLVEKIFEYEIPMMAPNPSLPPIVEEAGQGQGQPLLSKLSPSPAADFRSLTAVRNRASEPQQSSRTAGLGLDRRQLTSYDDVEF